MKKSLSLFAANWLFLLTLLLVISIGSLMQMFNLSLGLIGTEVLLILLPALWFLRSGGIPLKTGLRLSPIRPGLALISLLLGVALFQFTVIIEAVMMQLTGMLSVPLPEGSLPTGVLDSALFFLALAVAAPICEEILFRGAIQGAYEQRRSAALAICLPSLMFAFYHLRLTGLPALLPAAFILGYVAWRTQSIYTTMLIHAGLNASSAINTLLGIHSGQGLPFISVWSGLAGLLVSLGLLWVIRRSYSAPAPMHAAPDPADALPAPAEALPAPRRAWLRVYWPLLVSALVYLLVAGLTLLPVLMPELAASTQLQYNSLPNQTPVVSEYQITNRVGEVVGEATCTTTPTQAAFRLECTSTHRAYEIKTATSMWSDGDHQANWSAAWDSQTLALIEYSYERVSPQNFGYRARFQEGRIVIDTPDQQVQSEANAAALLEFEWMWRTAAMEAPANAIFQAPFGYLKRWDERRQAALPSIQSELMRVKALAPLDVPAGRFEAYQITFGGQAAWYARDDSGFPRPVQFDDGMVTYSLVK